MATVLSELAESINFEQVNAEFLKTLNIAVIQRLGYLLELLRFCELANILFEKSKLAEIKFRKYPLSVLSKKKNYADFQINDKWKLIINEEVEIDEL